MMRQQKRTMPQIANALGVSRATLYRHLTLDVDQDEGEQAAKRLVDTSPTSGYQTMKNNRPDARCSDRRHRAPGRRADAGRI
jgi:hypothetical protein